LLWSSPSDEGGEGVDDPHAKRSQVTGPDIAVSQTLSRGEEKRARRIVKQDRGFARQKPQNLRGTTWLCRRCCAWYNYMMPARLDYASTSASRPRRRNWPAIAATVVALVALAISVFLDEIVAEFGFWHRGTMQRVLLIMMLAAVVLAGVGLLQARRTAVPGRYAVILLLCFGLLGGYWVTLPLWPVPRGGHPPYTRCGLNMCQLGLAMIMHSNENRGEFPQSLGDLLLTQDVTWHVFVCPSKSDSRPDAATMEEIAAQIDARFGIYTYIYLGSGLKNGVPPETLLLYEPLSNHRGVFNILRADARVELWPREKMEKMLAELEAGHNPPRAEMLK
jgi:hypothetical protein